MQYIKKEDKMKQRNINSLLQDQGLINLSTRTPKSTKKKLKNRNGKKARTLLKSQLGNY